jgi:error-prone DNA polymerase
MMAVLEDTTALIREHYHEEVDLAQLPQDDPKVFAALQKADTVGMFQVESRAQMSCLPRMCPRKFYDIVVQVAIIRPGPIVGQMLHPFLRRRQGKETPVSLHPLLDEVLARTLGVPLFQEQLLRMAMIVSGFTGGEAEELRRAMGFKRSEKRMQEIEVKLRAGMAKQDITGEVQDRIVQSITSFALYGFPESHAISFALIAYASAYLKCHYLGAFTAAILNNQPMGFYHPSTLVKDAQRHGLRVKPVHVNESEWLCRVEDRYTIRLGLNYVRGLRESAGKAIVSERLKGRFHSVDELRRRVPELHRDQITQLASIGALNFEDHRRSALWEAARLERPSGDLLASLEPEAAECPLEPMTPIERLNADIHGVSLSVGRHPIAHEREKLNRMRVVPAAEVSRRRNGTRIRVAGAVIARQRPGTAKGFVFLSMEDETGISNVIIKPDVFERCKETVVSSPFLIIEGILQNQEGVTSVRAERAQALRLRAAGIASHDFH